MPKKKSRSREPMLLPLAVPVEFIEDLLNVAAQARACSELRERIPARDFLKGIARRKKWDALPVPEQHIRMLFALLSQESPKGYKRAIAGQFDRLVHSTVFYDEKPAGVIFTLGGKPRHSIVVQFRAPKRLGAIVFLTDRNAEPIFPRGAESPAEAAVFHHALHQVADYLAFKFPKLAVKDVK